MTSGVSEELNTLSETMIEQRDLLQQGLDLIRTEFTGERAYQWRITAENLDHNEEGYTETFVAPIWAVRAHGELDFEPSVGGICFWPVAPFAGRWEIKSWAREDYPDALEARDKWARKLPQVRQYTNDQDVDLDELTEFPRKLGDFYDSWNTIRINMSGLHQALEDIRTQTDNGDWRGSAADSYGAIITAQQRGAEAVDTGIGNAIGHVAELSSKAVDTCKALLDLATDSANNMIDFAQEIVSFDPKQWLGTVNNIVDKMQELNEEHVQEVKDEMDAILQNVEWKVLVEEQFAELRVLLGGADMAWPPADGRGVWDVDS